MLCWGSGLIAEMSECRSSYKVGVNNPVVDLYSVTA